MQITFNKTELDVLAKEYRLGTSTSENWEYSIPATDLLETDKALAYLDKVNTIFEAPSRRGTASLFSKRYSCLVLASSLYALGAFNKGMNCEISNVHVESFHQGHAWLPKLRLNEWSLTVPPEGERTAWRDKVLQSIFKHNLTKVWHTLSKIAPISKAVLWENTAIYLFWLYESKFEEGLDEQVITRLRDDFNYLLYHASGELFGEQSNPLTKFATPKVTTRASANPFRLRKTCCFYYQTTEEPYDYCPSCPLIKHEVLS